MATSAADHIDGPTRLRAFLVAAAMTYSYANAIRESVFVQTTMDSDHDGKPDRIAADIMRPRRGPTAGQ